MITLFTESNLDMEEKAEYACRYGKTGKPFEDALVSFHNSLLATGVIKKWESIQPTSCDGVVLPWTLRHTQSAMCVFTRGAPA